MPKAAHLGRRSCAGMMQEVELQLKTERNPTNMVVAGLFLWQMLYCQLEGKGNSLFYMV